MASKFQVQLTGVLDEQQTSKKINETLKKVTKQVNNVEIDVDVSTNSIKQAEQSTKSLSTAVNNTLQNYTKLANLQSATTKDAIKLDALRKTNAEELHATEMKALEDSIKARREKLTIIEKEIQENKATTESIRETTKAMEEQARKASEAYAKISADNKVASYAQGNAKANSSALNWTDNQAVKITNELITLESKLTNSRKLANSSEAQVLQTTLKQQQVQLQQYREIIKTEGKQSDAAFKLKNAIDETTRSISTQKTAFKALENEGVNLWDKLTEKARDYFNYAIAAMTLQQAGQAVRQMINEVVELDGSLVELRKVTDLEGASLDAFIDKVYDAGQRVAATGQSVIDASTSFAKSGYDPDTALQLGEIALMYTNIADEEINAADAADMIIAQMKAFNIQASDSMHIIDAINAVSNNYAVSSADIANNLGKASAVMANAGNSMEQYIAMMTAITEITRSADKAANGKKIKPYVYSDIYSYTIPNPVTLKALMATA